MSFGLVEEGAYIGGRAAGTITFAAFAAYGVFAAAALALAAVPLATAGMVLLAALLEGVVWGAAAALGGAVIGALAGGIMRLIRGKEPEESPTSRFRVQKESPCQDTYKVTELAADTSPTVDQIHPKHDWEKNRTVSVTANNTADTTANIPDNAGCNTGFTAKIEQQRQTAASMPAHKPI